jgi:hypothetical protein
MEDFNQDQDTRRDKIAGERYVRAAQASPERIAERLKEEAEITAREWSEQSGSLVDRVPLVNRIDSTVTGSPKDRIYDALCAAAEGGKARQYQNCAAAPPAQTEATRNDFIMNLEKRSAYHFSQAKMHEQLAAENYIKAEKLIKAVNIITLQPDFDLLLEVLRLV